MARKKEPKVEVQEAVQEAEHCEEPVQEVKPEQIEQPVVEQPVVEQPVVEKPVDEPIYLRETLFAMDEIKQFGLNQYFLRAILEDQYYTLKQAKELINKALH